MPLNSTQHYSHTELTDFCEKFLLIFNCCWRKTGVGGWGVPHSRHLSLFHICSKVNKNGYWSGEDKKKTQARITCWLLTTGNEKKKEVFPVFRLSLWNQHLSFYQSKRSHLETAAVPPVHANKSAKTLLPKCYSQNPKLEAAPHAHHVYHNYKIKQFLWYAPSTCFLVINFLWRRLDYKTFQFNLNLISLWICL